MIRPAAGLPAIPRIRRLPKPLPASDSRHCESRPSYGRPFWFAYVANVLTLVAIALLYRYADFITLLGGTEFHLGWIVGVGIAGSIFTRLIIGSWIDRYGSRPLWIGSLLLFAVTCLAHLMLVSHAGAAIYLLRISYCCAVAGINGASMTFVSSRGPINKMAELVGMLGTAGFLGSVLGTQLGDFLIGGSAAIGRPQIVGMFVLAAGLATLAIPLAWAATRAEKRVSLVPMLRLKFPLVPMLRLKFPLVPMLRLKFPLVPMLRVGTRFFQRSALMGSATAEAEQCKLSVPTQSVGTSNPSPSLLAILRRHNPGLVLAVGVAMGIGLGLPATFLRPFAAELGIPRIGLFFMVYAVTAIITRVLTRRWVERFGPRPIIMFGMVGLSASIALFLLVGAEWQLVLPAFGFGCSHAVLFPAVVTAGSSSFPVGNRGMATLLVLATWDVGRLIGAPTAGATLRLARL
ncbi:MAG: MFS transporter, partial [Pirellulales bacterium]|nr:MFS transporter [Pirellulales bacterium]